MWPFWRASVRDDEQGPWRACRIADGGADGGTDGRANGGAYAADSDDNSVNPRRMLDSAVWKVNLRFVM